MEDNNSIGSIEEEVPETLAHEKTKNESPAAKNPNQHKRTSSKEATKLKEQPMICTLAYPHD